MISITAPRAGRFATTAIPVDSSGAVACFPCQAAILLFTCKSIVPMAVRKLTFFADGVAYKIGTHSVRQGGIK